MERELLLDMMPSNKIPDHHYNLKCKRGSIIDQQDPFLRESIRSVMQLENKMFLFKWFGLANIRLLTSCYQYILDDIQYTTILQKHGILKWDHIRGE
jgi:hypothetical protein